MQFFPIPPLFHSLYHGAAFETCVDCEEPLSPSGQVYSIHKFIVAGEAVFEMAICDRCRSNLHARFSDESKAAILGYIEERAATRAAQETAETGPKDEAPAIDLDTLPSMQACVLCQTPKSQLRRYGLVGLCSGEELLVLGQGEAAIPMPCLICDRCNQGLEKKLSKATREEWDRFVEEHFPGPPGVELDPVHDRPIMV